MPFFRQFVAPLLIFLMFLFALVVVSSRAFLSEDMAAPAPIGGLEVTANPGTSSISNELSSETH